MWRERHKIIDAWKAGRAAALATLVAVDGSSYRKPGARLLVTTDGGHVGSLSGGCLEAEVARKARWHVRNGACMQRYSTAFDDETNEIPFGLGCGGTIDILMEPADTPEFQCIMEALAASMRGHAADIYTSLPANGIALSRTVRFASGNMEPMGCELPDPSDPGAYHHERLDPPQRLLIFGAGDDAQSLVHMTSLLGWRVLILDSRAQLARPERFPQAEQVLFAPLEGALPLPLQPDDFAVVMTHSYEQDRAWLQLLLPEKLPYLGLLGARHRGARLAGDLASLLDWPLEQVCEHLRAPVGLDLGGDGADTIALAITAEMQAFASRRSLLSRRMSATTVAEQIALAEHTRYPPAQCTL